MNLGVDLSILEELRKLNKKFYYKGKEINPFQFFSQNNGVKSVRLRLWNNPYDQNNHPYGGGTNDLNTDLKLAKEARDNGMSVLLDFHYSDFWADPSRQIAPKAWLDLSFEEVEIKLYQYTKNTLLEFKKENIDIIGVQIGNEVTHGICYPFGDIYNGSTFEKLARLFKAGIKAVKEVYKDAKTVIHLEHSCSKDMQESFVSNLIKNNVDFDVVGESYYPYWHGPFSKLKENVLNLQNKFKKEVWIVEFSYEYHEKETNEPLFHEINEADLIVGNMEGRIPFPFTKEGQRDYLKYLIKFCKDLDIKMLYYWEPCWCFKDVKWANLIGKKYCGLENDQNSTWNYSSLFDTEGNANIALDEFRE